MPQGSILGPILFILYINDIIEEIKVKIKIYADDVSLFVQYENSAEAADSLQEDIMKCEAWAKIWMVKFNPQKTESLLLSRKRESDLPELIMENTVITEVKEHKHLGLTLQKNGKWTQQVREMKIKTNKRIDVLRGHMHRLGRKSLERLYLTYIRPILEYGNIVWDNLTIKKQENLRRSSYQQRE